jgi:hypothetical protein
MSATTTSAADTKAFSVESMLEAKRQLDKLFEPGEFMLVDPQGRVWKAPTYDALVLQTCHMHALIAPPLACQIPVGPAYSRRRDDGVGG